MDINRFSGIGLPSSFGIGAYAPPKGGGGLPIVALTEPALPDMTGKDWAYWDVSDLSTLFQDTAGTTPVAANADNLSRVNDKSGNGHHLLLQGATAFVYRDDGLVPYASAGGSSGQSFVASVPSFDGRDCFMAIAMLATDLTWQTQSVIIQFARASSNTGLVQLEDNGDLWRNLMGSDAGVYDVDSFDNSSAEQYNGHVLMSRSELGSKSTWLDDVKRVATSGTDALTPDRISVFGSNKLTTNTNRVKGRMFAAVAVMDNITDEEAEQLAAWLSYKAFYWQKIKDSYTEGNFAAPSYMSGITYPWDLQKGPYWYFDCLAATTLNTSLTDALVTGADLGGDYGTQRLRARTCPIHGGKAFHMVLNKDDDDTGGVDKKRIEFSFQNADANKFEQDVWHTFALIFRPGEDWSGTTDDTVSWTETAATGDSSILFQIHAGEGIPQGPYFTLFARNMQLRAGYRYQTDGYDNPISGSQDYVTTLSTSRYTQIGVAIKPNFAGGGRLKVWDATNGDRAKLVLDVTGPIGFDTGSVLGHAKHGIYKPLDVSQVFNASVPTRSIWTPGFVMRKGDDVNVADLIAIQRRILGIT